MTERYAVNRGNARWRVVDGEVVVINVNNTYYYGLNQTGTFLWSLLSEADRTLDELVDEVAERYGQPEERVRPDVQSVIEDLLAEELVAIRDQA